MRRRKRPARDVSKRRWTTSGAAVNRAEEIALGSTASKPPHEALKAIELIERDSSASGHSAAPSEYAERMGIETLSVGSARVMVTAKSRSLRANRTVGLGVVSPATERQVERILELYHERRVRRFSLTLAPIARPRKLESWLEERGLRFRRGSGKLWRDATDPGPPPRSELRVEEIGPERAEVWFDLMSSIWLNFRTRGEWITARVGRPGWRHYIAYRGKEPAGVAALFVKDGAGHLVEGCVLARYRRRGGQSLLIHRRVRDALADRCTWLTSETAPPLPRMPLVSHRNLLRAGFQLAYIRPSWKYDPDER